MATVNLTAQRLRDLLDYDPETGVFIWRMNRGNGRVGAVAGNLNHGRLEIGIDGRMFSAHRAAWLYMTGQNASGEVDHKDGNPLNNRFVNLRDVSRSVNQQNQRRAKASNKLGFLGVCLCKRSGRYIASIGLNRKMIRLGRFDTPELAHAAYLEAKRKLHEGCTI